MFGLFDKPRTAIRKRTPVSAAIEFVAVETLADMRLKDKGIEGFQREAAVGFVLSVWACNSAYAAKFGLSDYAYQYIRNLGLNYADRMHPEPTNVARDVLFELMSCGVVSLPTSAAVWTPDFCGPYFFLRPGVPTMSGPRTQPDAQRPHERC